MYHKRHPTRHFYHLRPRKSHYWFHCHPIFISYAFQGESLKVRINTRLDICPFRSMNQFDQLHLRLLPMWTTSGSGDRGRGSGGIVLSFGDMWQMQTLSTLPGLTVILATRTHKRITHWTQQKITKPYFVLRFFTVNIFLRLTVKILSFLSQTAKPLAVLRLKVSPIETLLRGSSYKSELICYLEWQKDNFFWQLVAFYL